MQCDDGETEVGLSVYMDDMLGISGMCRILMFCSPEIWLVSDLTGLLTHVRILYMQYDDICLFPTTRPQRPQSPHASPLLYFAFESNKCPLFPPLTASP